MNTGLYKDKKISIGRVYKHRKDRQYLFVIRMVKRGFYKTAVIYNGRLEWDSEVVSKDYIFEHYYHRPIKNKRIYNQFEKLLNKN